jgi:tetratricopeptide (TPR) repeat protein
MAALLETIPQPDDAPVVFVSYSHRDEDWKKKLLPQLEQLGRLGVLNVWDDRQIKAGVDWYARIREVLEKTRCAVCLISENFLNSSFCMDEEIPYLLQRRHRRRLELFPVLLSDCVWDEHPWLKRWQILPRDAKPIATHFAPDPASVFADVARQVRDYLRTGKGHERPALPGPAPKVDIDRLPQSDDLLFGRRQELNFLNKAWDDQQLNVVVFKASGGVGKTTLVRCWVDAMAEDNYRGAERVFAWSFYSQGTGERVTSGDEFMAKALEWFGDESAGKGLSAWDRGHRLARLIQRGRTLLLLDGLEPLQSGYAFDRGKLKDPGLEVLLFELARRNPGLCVITTREPLADLADDEIKAGVRQFDLDQISTIAGRALLRVSGIQGTDEELEGTVTAFGNHAYAIKLLGAWIGQWHDKHVSRAAGIADLDIPLQKGRHPRRVMQAFAERFDDGPKANLLALIGLFDRPAAAALIAALRERPAIAGLTDHLVDLGGKAWDDEIAALRRLGLLAESSHHAPGEIDAHPLVREHFGERLKAEQPAAWRAGHGRLYEHLKQSAKALPDTLAEMAPLFQAMHHGCQAARHQEALEEVYWARIVRRDQAYVVKKLGAVGSDLAALAGLFDPPWDRPVATLTEAVQAFILNQAAYWLRALGRLREAVAPMRAGLERYVAQENWQYAAIVAGNLSELQLTLGDVAQAVAMGEASFGHADRSGDAFPRMVSHTTWADALHQAGEVARAQALFEAAEALQAEGQPEHPRLYSLRGYRYCDLLLAQGRAAEVRDRARYAIKVAEANNWLLDIALDHLALGRAALALGEPGEARAQLDQAVDGLRQAGQQDYLTRGLLARAALFRETGDFPEARRDLDEAMRIARRSEMRLFQCDAHLESARLALAQRDPETARNELAAARDLVKETGYNRRQPELAQLEARLRQA